jgi:hypothetical protein
MIRILFLAAIPLLLMAAPANAQQWARGQVGSQTYIYPAGTLAYNQGPNGVWSSYYYVPPVNYGYYGPATYGNLQTYGASRGRYYVQPNGGGGGYYSYVPSTNGYYGPNR